MGQYNNGYRRPNFSGSQNFGVPSNSSLAPVPVSKKTKPRKKIIIVVIALIILSSLLCIEILSSKNRDIPDEGNYIEEISKYANLIMFGEENSDRRITDIEYDTDTKYYIESVRANEEELIDLLSKAKEIIESIEMDDISNDWLYVPIKRTREEILFMGEYLNSKYEEPELTIQSFLQNGKENELQKVQSFYEPLINSESYFEQEYGEERMDYYTQLIEQTEEIASVNSCIEEGQGQEGECSTMLKIWREEKISEVGGDRYVEQLIQDLLTQCWNIQGAIKNEE